MRGRLLWVLHAHLPFVRHPEHPRFFEEDWLFEAQEAVYLPLLEVFEGWLEDRVDARVTLSVSSSLAAMWQDSLLQARFRAYLDRRSALFHDERRRLWRDPVFGPLAEAEAARVSRARRTYERIGGDLAGAFRRQAEAGALELATSSLTHALLPAFASCPGFAQRQIEAATRLHASRFGRPPLAFWLPECAWWDGAGAALAAAGVRATVLEGHGLVHGAPPAACGVSRPAVTSSGVVVFGRHPEVARAVWSRDVGFPGDGRYLDFHRDATGELSDEAVQPHLLPTGSRVPLRLRYHRVTDRHLPASAKQPYEPEAAEAATAEHAEQFLAGLSEQLEAQGARLGWSALAVAPFDAELFGHWWREGPRFIDALARRTAGRLTWTTPTRELEREEPVELLEPAPGTWGAGADFSVWVAPETGPLWTRILEAVSDLERRRPPRAPRAKRAYALLEREVDLAAASDWTFLIRMKTAVDYARARVETHLENAAVLRRMLDGGAYDLAKLAELEARGGPTG